VDIVDIVEKRGKGSMRADEKTIFFKVEKRRRKRQSYPQEKRKISTCFFEEKSSEACGYCG